ncbi:OmpA family protein [candidate division KSB1 bacterium]|nr:OmpA family protein [candidate division KSB1 bacterium]
MDIDLYKFDVRSDPEEKSQWLLSYSDMVTLLLCFFALFFAISRVDTVKYEMITEYFNRSSKMPLHELEKQMEALVTKHDLDNEVDVKLTQEGLELDFQDKILFDSGMAELKRDAFPILKSIANILRSPAVRQRKIQVAGHTDTVPIHRDSIYPSNWELSSARASRVIRYFLAHKFEKERFEAIGYADTKLRVKESVSEKGLAVNRRVVLLIK